MLKCGNCESDIEKFTELDLRLWYPYADSYFLKILNGEYSVEAAREDLLILRKEESDEVRL